MNYLGLCPFHNEKTPSFTVSPTKGIYKCFGCGKGGNVVNFVMEQEHISYPEALKYLAKKYNIEIRETELTQEKIDEATERESLLIVSEFAQNYFSKNLHGHKEGIAIGLSYFVQHRGISEVMVKKFQLGYALDEKDAFTKAAMENGYSLDYLVKTGLTVKKEDWKADRFNGRVIFPIHNVTGRVIAFGGRTLKTDKNIAKYLNSPESEIYNKSKVLYGLFFAKKAIIEKEKCYLVEGYTDVISLHQAGIENVVASSGTSLTQEQIRLVKRFTKNITILYDGDLAGIKASLRGINMLLEEGMDIKVLLFPDGEDPDSYSHKLSSSEFLEFLSKNETDFISFKTKLLIADAKKDPIKKAQLITDIVESIGIIPDAIKRSVFTKECSVLMDIDEQVLITEVNKIRKKIRQQKFEAEKIPENIEEAVQELPEKKDFPAGKFENEERALVRLLLHFGDSELFRNKPEDEETDEEQIVFVSNFILQQILNDELEFTTPVYKKIFDEYHHSMIENKIPDAKYFVNHPDHEISKSVADIFSKDYTLSRIHKAGGVFVETEEMKLREIVPKTVFEYKNKVILSKLKQIEAQLKKAQEENDFVLFDELQQSYISFTELKKKLSKLLGGRTIV